MAKKNIISDFKSLKGKISFTEKVYETKSPSYSTTTETETVKSRPGDNDIKIGQSVVLMDCGLRGKITALDKTVRIELEDGLIIESAYGEFAVTDKTELAYMREVEVKANKVSVPRDYGITIKPERRLIIDLHIEAIPGGTNIQKGQQLQFQMDTFRRIIRKYINHRGMTISFIHGIGDGILKASIRKELDEIFALRCSYSVGDPAVTVVSIK